MDIKQQIPQPTIARQQHNAVIPFLPHNQYQANVTALLDTFEPITLAGMTDVSLLKRIDTKYLIPSGCFPAILAELAPYYRVLDIKGARLQPYETLYFDTPDFALYRHHHAGGRNRYKVRSRTYLNSDLSFLEVKFKSNKKETIKNRVSTPALVTDISDTESAFLSRYFPLDASELEPKLYNRYTRISLVSNSEIERLTLDLRLCFRYGTNQAALPDIVVAEVKRQTHGQDSIFCHLMRDYHLRPDSFSKYSMGVNLLYPDQKQNRFKKNHRQIAKLQEGDWNVHA